MNKEILHFVQNDCETRVGKWGKTAETQPVSAVFPHFSPSRGVIPNGAKRNEESHYIK